MSAHFGRGRERQGEEEEEVLLTADKGEGRRRRRRRRRRRECGCNRIKGAKGTGSASTKKRGHTCEHVGVPAANRFEICRVHGEEGVEVLKYSRLFGRLCEHRTGDNVQGCQTRKNARQAGDSV